MTEQRQATLYDRIGPAFIEDALTEFYKRAFVDPIIAHIFFHHDREQITRMQIDFATAMLGGPRRYKGKPLEAAHRSLGIRPPHFARRQRLLAEVFDEYQLDPVLRDAWLRLEEQLRPLIMQPGSVSCSPPS